MQVFCVVVEEFQENKRYSLKNIERFKKVAAL